ncbi:hypothetical protein C7999DRAFT_28103 [Corynascus novoguineensis]|uniref:Infection structure specific protein n=1 Tax=Corynascus novoguineensis TaxID=1126955 RepID=A0AAN7HNE5_9PEZI|nr:hypothetical protein C7999DRAFT_28103 [Corynascus novoguineensis]
MIAQNLLLVLAGVASANVLNTRLDLDDVETPSEECLSAMKDISLPDISVDPIVASFYATQTDVTDYCQITAPPDVQSAIDEYTSAYSSWYAENGDALASISEHCPTAPSITGTIPTCTGGAGSSGSSGGDDSSEGDDDEDRPNNAARQTGLIGAVVAVAGILGVAVVL